MRALLALTGTLYWYALLVRFTGTLYWYALLVRFTGTLYWYALLVRLLAGLCLQGHARATTSRSHYSIFYALLLLLLKPSCKKAYQ